ncbi:Endonuclease 8-like 3 [Vulpes lagopus]
MDLAIKNEDSSIGFTNLVKYPCNSFGKPSTEVKINRKTAFGTTTLVLVDFSNKSSGLERKTSQNQILDGEFQNPPRTNICSSDDPLHPSKERTNRTPQSSDKVNVSPAVCAQSKLFSPAYKKLKTTHSSSPDLKSGHPGFSNSYSVHLADKMPSRSSQHNTSKAGGPLRGFIAKCAMSEPGINMTDGACMLNADSPRCSKHNRLCALRIVRKDGDNKGRWFYACSLPREAQCGFFQRGQICPSHSATMANAPS